MWSHNGWDGWWFFMPLVMVAFWAVVIWIAVSLVGTRPGAAPPERDRPATPEEILAERFARGEIDDADYRLRLDTLRARRPAESSTTRGER